MVERFLKQTKFTSVEDYNKNLEFIIPENFNFAYDVMDAWAEEAPEKLAILWTNDQGEEIRTTYGELKEQTDQAASYLLTLGIGKNDPVMLILKRRYGYCHKPGIRDAKRHLYGLPGSGNKGRRNHLLPHFWRRRDPLHRSLHGVGTLRPGGLVNS